MHPKNYVPFVLLILVIAIAGCVQLSDIVTLDDTAPEKAPIEPLQEPEEPVQEESKEEQEPEPIQDNKTDTDKIQTDDPVVELPPEPENTRPIFMFKSYIQDNYEPTFDEQVSRMLSLEIENKTATLVYETGTSDPGTESIYLQGALFVVFSDINTAITRGRNTQGDTIPSAARGTTRVGYDFNRRYFTLEEIESSSVFECSVHSACDDNNPCTTDTCANSKCNNVQINDCTFPGLQLLGTTDYRGSVSSRYLEEFEIKFPKSYIHPTKYVLFITGEIHNLGDLLGEPNVTVSVFEADEKLVSTHAINTTPLTLSKDGGKGTFELILEDYEGLEYFSVAVLPKEE